MLVALNKEKEAQSSLCLYHMKTQRGDDCLKTRNRVFTNQNFDLGLPSIQNYEKLLFKLPSGEGNGNPHQYSCMEKSHGRRSLVGYSPWGLEESDMTE